MRVRKLITVLLVTLICWPASGCTLPDAVLSESSSEQTAHNALRFDTAAMKKDAEALTAAAKEPDREEEISGRIDDMLDSVDEAYAKHIRAQIAYYSDWNNTRS